MVAEKSDKRNKNPGGPEAPEGVKDEAMASLAVHQTSPRRTILMMMVREDVDWENTVRPFRED